MSEPEPRPEQQIEEEEESIVSQEDDDAQLLTDKVEEKLLATLAKIRSKHPSIYNTTAPLFQDEDFAAPEHQSAPTASQKFTYKDLLQGGEGDSDREEELAPVHEQKRAKDSFKKALDRKIQDIQNDADDLFTVKGKVGASVEAGEELGQKQKLRELTRGFEKQNRKLVKKMLKGDELDETDLFLKNYILDKKWLSSKLKAQAEPQEVMVDEEDEQRSQEMDEYEQQYNFRFEEPGGNTITQYPRKLKDSLRQKPETRKEKRKRTEEKKKQEEAQLRKQAEVKRGQLKQSILERLAPENDEEDHDWFFCDDCCRGLEEGETIWQCQECEDYMLCESCNELIIHKHPLQQAQVPPGCGAPPACENTLKELKSCKTCRRRITPTRKRYEYTDHAYLLNVLCEGCYDSSGLDIKKKYKEVQPESHNYEELLENDPQKIKELTNIQEIEEMVDEYMRTEFQDVIGGGVKTKFRYIPVKPESYGLSDEQILFGQDKELNKYVSIKKLVPYADETLRLRNSIFKKKVKSINKSVKDNKKVVAAGEAKIARTRRLSKLKQRAEAVRIRRHKRLRILNLSSQEKERNHYVSSNRLLSYGIAQPEQQQ